MSWLLKLISEGAEPLTSDADAGFHVLAADAESSMGADAGLEPYFDFLVGVDGHRFTQRTDQLLLERAFPHALAEDRPVTLDVWSCKGSIVRSVSLPVGARTLGLVLQWSPVSIVHDVWHILDVATGSPAHAAGLISYEDYVIGAAEGTGTLIGAGEGALGLLAGDYEGKQEAMQLYVYSHPHEVVRRVEVLPRRDWGGGGLLGCGVGYGLLHRIPAPVEQEHAHGETLFDKADEADFYVPAEQLGVSREKPKRSVHINELREDPEEGPGDTGMEEATPAQADVDEDAQAYSSS